MVLRSDRRVAPTTAELRAPEPSSGFSVADVGRLLSRERNRQGLSLREVGTRTGIPVDQLRAAETGVLDRPDGLASLKTVRRYADFLGLPGDRFALAILERWPTKAGPRPFSPTAAVPAVGPLAALATTATWPAAAHGSGHASADHEPTRLVEAVGPSAPLPSQRGDQTSWGAYSDTGVTPAVQAPAGQVWRRPRRGAPVALQALVVLVSVAVLAGIVLLALDRLEPSWLRAVGITHRAPSAAPAPAAPSRPAATNPSAPLAAGATSAGALRPHMSHGRTVFVVPASTFTVTLTSPRGPCWVQATADTASAPTYDGMIGPGAPHTFSHVRSLAVEMASTAGRLSITWAGGHLTSYAPRGAYPYKITVRAKR